MEGELDCSELNSLFEGQCVDHSEDTASYVLVWSLVQMIQSVNSVVARASVYRDKNVEFLVQFC